MDIKQSISDAELILIGIGEELAVEEGRGRDEVLDAYNTIANLTEGKNYYVVTLLKDDVIFESDLDNERIVAPFYDDEETGSRKWDKYLKWLSFTLNKKLFVLELGVGLGVPEIIRWPFEKTVMLNNKASLLRINSLLPNIPEQISGKAEGISRNPVSFLSCLDS